MFGKKIDLTDRYAFDGTSEPKIIDATAAFAGDESRAMSVPGSGSLFAYGSPLTQDDLGAVQEYLRIGATELWTLIKVETRGYGFYRSKRPVILFERHKFHKYTHGKYDRSHPGISNKTGGGDYSHKNQINRLNEAIGLNREAALMSASWGLGQVMGFNYEAAEFDNVEDMVSALERSEGEQLWAMARFIKNNGLDDELRDHRWARFAEKYNGAGYAKNEYDIKLASNFARYKAGKVPDLRVRATQLCLRYLNYNPGPVDGQNGKGTRGALNLFRADVNLPESDEIDDDSYSLLKIAADRVDRGPGVAAGTLAGISLAGIAGAAGAGVGGAGKGSGGKSAAAGIATVGVGGDLAAEFSKDVAEKEGLVGDEIVVPDADVETPAVEVVEEPVQDAAATEEPAVEEPVEPAAEETVEPAVGEPVEPVTEEPVEAAVEEPVEPEEPAASEVPAPAVPADETAQEPVQEPIAEDGEPTVSEVEDVVVDEVPVPDSPPPLDDTVEVIREAPPIAGEPAPEVIPVPAVEPEPETPVPVEEPVVEPEPEPEPEPDLEAEVGPEPETEAPTPELTPEPAPVEPQAESSPDVPTGETEVGVETTDQVDAQPFDLEEAIAVVTDLYQSVVDWYPIVVEFYHKTVGVIGWFIDRDFQGGEVQAWAYQRMLNNEWVASTVTYLYEQPLIQYGFRAAVFASLIMVYGRSVQRFVAALSPMNIFRRLFGRRRSEMARILRKHVLRKV